MKEKIKKFGTWLGLTVVAMSPMIIIMCSIIWLLNSKFQMQTIKLLAMLMVALIMFGLLWFTDFLHWKIDRIFVKSVTKPETDPEKFPGEETLKKLTVKIYAKELKPITVNSHVTISKYELDQSKEDAFNIRRWGKYKLVENMRDQLVGLMKIHERRSESGGIIMSGQLRVVYEEADEIDETDV